MMIEIIRIAEGRRLIETIDPRLWLSVGGADFPRSLPTTSREREPVRCPCDCRDMYSFSSKRNRGQQPRRRFSRESIRFAA
ncbi:MAG: hypothetical protein V1738_00835 [Patescibacteria group bacterium]